jgi:hypothetical protein
VSGLIGIAGRRSCRTSHIDTLAATMLLGMARHVNFVAADLVGPYDIPDAAPVL